MDIPHPWGAIPKQTKSLQALHMGGVQESRLLPPTGRFTSWPLQDPSSQCQSCFFKTLISLICMSYFNITRHSTTYKLARKKYMNQVRMHAHVTIVDRSVTSESWGAHCMQGSSFALNYTPLFLFLFNIKASFNLIGECKWDMCTFSWLLYTYIITYLYGMMFSTHLI